MSSVDAEEITRQKDNIVAYILKKAEATRKYGKKTPLSGNYAEEARRLEILAEEIDIGLWSEEN